MINFLLVATIFLCQSGGPLSPMALGGKLVVARTSWYGDECQGQEMAYGGLFDKNDPGIAAHRTFPPGTILKLWNITEGKDGKIEIKEAQVTIRDRGPNIESRDLDISEAAAKRINLDGVKALLVWVAN